jgi:hypothetical protein
MEVKETKVTIEELEAIGGRRWQKGEMDRVYINDLPRWLGLEVTFYKTGNVSAARLRGEQISNSKASRILQRLHDAKLWWDVQSGKWESRGIDDADRKYIVAAIMAEVERRRKTQHQDPTHAVVEK